MADVVSIVRPKGVASRGAVNAAFGAYISGRTRELTVHRAPLSACRHHDIALIRY